MLICLGRIRALKVVARHEGRYDVHLVAFMQDSKFNQLRDKLGPLCFPDEEACLLALRRVENGDSDEFFVAIPQ